MQYMGKGGNKTSAETVNKKKMIQENILRWSGLDFGDV